MEAILRIWKGERDETVLTDGLDKEEAKIIHVVLEGIAKPEILKPLVEILEEATERRKGV